MESSDRCLPDPRLDLTELEAGMLDVHGEQSEAVIVTDLPAEEPRRRSPSRPDIAISQRERDRRRFRPRDVTGLPGVVHRKRFRLNAPPGDTCRTMKRPFGSTSDPEREPIIVHACWTCQYRKSEKFFTPHGQLLLTWPQTGLKSRTELARALGRSQQRTSEWRRAGKIPRISFFCCNLSLEAAGAKVPDHLIRQAQRAATRRP
jgi:hypothetical protein